MNIQDLLAALSGVFNGVTQSVMAMTFGFAMLPSLFAYLVGIAGCLIFNSAVPISFQAETMALAGSMGDTKQERLSIVVFAGLGMAVLGAFGLLETIVNFAGEDITAAMMAGVGLILARISFTMVKDDPVNGSVSLGTGILAYLITRNLVYTSLVSVVAASVTDYFTGSEDTPTPVIDDRIVFHKPVVSAKVLRGTLALICITIGGNIAFGGVSGAISGVPVNADHISIYSGLADVASALFGGSPISVVISPAAAAPHAQIAIILMMAIMAIILASRVLPKIVKFIPSSAVSGTLFILGAVMTAPGNLATAFRAADSLAALGCALTLTVTVFIDPFFGMLSGIAVKLFGAALGLG